MLLRRNQKSKPTGTIWDSIKCEIPVWERAKLQQLWAYVRWKDGEDRSSERCEGAAVESVNKWNRQGKSNNVVSLPNVLQVHRTVFP